VDNQRDKEVAIKAALQAGSYIKERLGNIKRIDYKSAFNIVTDVDKRSETIILDLIRSEFPHDSIVAEEGGGGMDQIDRCWYVDPLDGTTNFTHTYPFFCVSIGLEVSGKMEVGVVYNPCADELFVAQSGKGAFLNNEPISTSKIESMEESLMATGFAADTATSEHSNIETFHTLTNLSHGVRRDGSAALDLCFVACGRLDCFWEMHLSSWDLAAGSLIVQEAGGKVSNLINGEFDMKSGHILASNGLIHDQVVDILKKFSAVKASHGIKG
jgi:myo-inositol-1(or 4)-monophosphatase